MFSGPSQTRLWGSHSVIGEKHMANLKGSRTEESLKAAFAEEAQAYQRYMDFANRADIEGQPDVAALFRATAAGEAGHALGHLEYLHDDPATNMPIGSTRKNLLSVIESETGEYEGMYPEMARIAREEGFNEIADWFETLSKAERSHAHRFQQALDDLVD